MAASRHSVGAALDLLLPHRPHDTYTMGNVCSTDSFHEPLIASDRDAGAAESPAELEAHNAALSRQLAEAEAEVRALRAQVDEEDRSPEAKSGGGAAATKSEEHRLRLDEAERQGAKDREAIEALRVELEQARKDRAGEEKVAATGDGGAPPALPLNDANDGENKFDAAGTVVGGQTDDILIEMKVRRRCAHTHTHPHIHSRTHT